MKRFGVKVVGSEDWGEESGKGLKLIAWLLTFIDGEQNMAINGTFGSSLPEIYIYRQRFFFFLGYIHGFKIKTTKYGVYCHVFVVLYKVVAPIPIVLRSGIRV